MLPETKLGQTYALIWGEDEFHADTVFVRDIHNAKKAAPASTAVASIPDPKTNIAATTVVNPRQFSNWQI